MTKKEEIIKDIKEKQLTRKEIAEKHGVSSTYISQIKKSMVIVPIELLKFYDNFFKTYFDYLIKNPEIKMFIKLNKEKLNAIEELIK